MSIKGGNEDYWKQDKNGVALGSLKTMQEHKIGSGGGICRCDE